MDKLHISTSKKMKDAKPTEVRRVGFFKIRKRYEYDFTSPTEYWRVLSKNRDVRIGAVGAVTGGIMKGGAAL